MFNKKEKIELKTHPEVSVYGERTWKDSISEWFKHIMSKLK